MKRRKSILDPNFQYVRSAETDLRKTFARVRREQRRAKGEGGAEAEKPAHVPPIKRRVPR
jgi:hypothetical protein